MTGEEGRAQRNCNLGVMPRHVEPRVGRLPLIGRYHKFPRTLSAEYHLTSKVLGTGCNGSVRMANKLGSQGARPFAVKTFNTKGMTADKLDQLQAEIEIFMCMDHPQIARLVDVYEAEHSIDLVMECMSGGELYDRVKSCKRFAERDAAFVAKQMLLAVSYIHSQGIVHRDLKLENFIYDTEGSNHLKLIDFGFGKFYNRRLRMKTTCGTLSYVAPEVLSKSYTSQCDLWSLGVIIFTLLSGRMPFYGEDCDQIRNIRKGRFSMKHDHWKDVSEAACNFVHFLLEVDPEKRLTAPAALQDSWITMLCPAPPLDFQPVVSALRSWILAPKLLRVSFLMMTWQLTNDQEAKFRDHFLAMDSNHDGAISWFELRSVLVDMYKVSEEEFGTVFNVFLEHHDGQILYSDFLAAMACYSVDPDDDMLRATFQKFDTRGTGYIHAQDLHQVLGKCGEAAALVQEANAIQRDGHIEYGEFAEYVKSGRESLKEQSRSVLQAPFPKISLQEFPSRAPTLLETQYPRAEGAEVDIGKISRKTFKKDSRKFQKLDIEDACCSVM